ncbi:MAG: hypothetical protein HKN51_08725 [Saprospiraceae bacterium]|nr:hypothetical protein [Saprospiraceae bacterium]
MMKTTALIISFIIAGFTLSAQEIKCPDDVNVHLFDLDLSYSSYGSPTINLSGPYELDKTVTIVDNSCVDRKANINYKLEETNTGNVYTCTQTIHIELPTLDDVIWPEPSITLEFGEPDDLKPENIGGPEPAEFLDGNSTILTAYEDQVVESSPTGPYKIVRSWTALDWCTSKTSMFNQVLKINEITNTALGVTTVKDCNGNDVSVIDVIVSTDETGFAVDLSACDPSSGSLLEFMNCVAANNDISNDSSFKLSLRGNDNYLDGVSTLDMVISQRHILGISPLGSSCKLIAADVNNDGRVSALDLLIMRKLILNIITSIPNNTAWKFINENTLNPNISDLNDKDLDFKKSEFPLQSLDIIAIKTGDVNNSASGN